MVSVALGIGEPTHGYEATREAALVQGIENGMTYFNIHTTMFPMGEIRGQLEPVPASSPVRDFQV